jgi:hypothetical protein
MPDTVREGIIKAIIARAATLSPLAVLRCARPNITGGVTTRSVSVWDDAENVTSDEPYGDVMMRMEIRVDMAANADAPSVAANAALGECVAAVIGTDLTLGGLAQSVQYLGAQPEYDSDGAREWSMRVTFSVDYGYPHGDPFTPV